MLLAIEGLSPFECWMVKSNLDRIEAGEWGAAGLVLLLRLNGYGRVADAVERLAGGG